MKEEKFLPIGSVVIVRGSVKKLLIIARALFAEASGKKQYFDYGACTYPEGVLGENILYLQHENIVEVVYKGYVDEDEERMLENIKDGLEKIEQEKKEETSHAGR